MSVEINDTEIDFDSMTDDELKEFLAKLTAEIAAKGPRKVMKSPPEPKKKREYKRIEI